MSADEPKGRADGAYGLTPAGRCIVGILVGAGVSIAWFTAILQTNSGTALEWVGWTPPLVCLGFAASWRLRTRRTPMAIGVLAGAVGIAPILFLLAWFFNGISHWEF